jgi:glycosyltransferase involved in cell wall biosynthesis
MTPRLSIITPSFNQGRFLEETILSVLNQNYENLEYIIIDGGSSDDSVAIIRRYERHLAYWISEPDRGQVHAINKGIERITGDVAAFINSDDIYLPGAFAEAMQFFREDPQCQWLCGDTILFGDGYPTQLIEANVPKSAAHCLSWAFNAPQPGMFWRAPLMKRKFDERWQYVFDCDLYTRLLLEGFTCTHLAVPVAKYRLHATSKTVAEGDRMDREFDAIAEHYMNELHGAGRRWCRATQLMRRSVEASGHGDRLTAAASLGRALLLHPESVGSRTFWGTLHRLVRPERSRQGT